MMKNVKVCGCVCVCVCVGVDQALLVLLRGSLYPGNQLYFDRYLSNMTCLKELKKNGMIRYIPEDVDKPARLAGPHGSQSSQ